MQKKLQILCCTKLKYNKKSVLFEKERKMFEGRQKRTPGSEHFDEQPATILL